MNRVEQGGVARGDLDAARIGLLKKHPDPALAARVSKLFAATQLPQRQQVVDQYQDSLQATGVAARGKTVFKKVCSACHRLEGVGTAVGADLKGIRGRGMAAVLLNILDPNREVKPQFQAYVIVTDDGRVTTGMIQAENANSLTIRRADGSSVAIQRHQIEELRGTGVSFMPAGSGEADRPASDGGFTRLSRFVAVVACNAPLPPGRAAGETIVAQQCRFDEGCRSSAKLMAREPADGGTTLDAADIRLHLV